MARKRNHVVAQWRGNHAFDAGRPGAGTQVHIEGSGPTGPSPVDALLIALATCTGYDVEDILAKRRTPLAAMEIDVQAERRETPPARLESVVLTYRLRGEGIDREHAERAVELSVTKYCSVRDSLAPDIDIRWVVELE